MKKPINEIVIPTICVDTLVAVSFLREFGESKFPGVSKATVSVRVLSESKDYWLNRKVMPVGQHFRKKHVESCSARMQREVVKLVTGDVKKLVSACCRIQNDSQEEPGSFGSLLHSAKLIGMSDEEIIQWGLRASDALVYYAMGSESLNTLHPLNVFEAIKSTIDNKVVNQVRRILVERNKHEVLSLSAVVTALTTYEKKQQVNDWVATAIRIIAEQQKGLLKAEKEIARAYFVRLRSFQSDPVDMCIVHSDNNQVLDAAKSAGANVCVVVLSSGNVNIHIDESLSGFIPNLYYVFLTNELDNRVSNWVMRDEGIFNVGKPTVIPLKNIEHLLISSLSVSPR